MRYFVQDILFDVVDKPVVLLPGAEPCFLTGLVMFVWTFSLAALEKLWR